MTAVAPSRRQVRHQATQADIVEAAWKLARRDGLAALTMRDLAAEVGMKAPSLYSYFASKHEIYDAMFFEGYRAFNAWMANATEPRRTDTARRRARRGLRAYIDFCTRDPVRFQLLFLRTIPNFEPSAHSYIEARSALDALAAQLRAIGIVDAATVDLWTAVATGLASQQIANDPGGTRWQRLANRAADMLLDEATR